MAPPNNPAPPADTVYALSSGAPPAAIAVVRISGPDASIALTALAGRLPPPRRASLRTLSGADGEALDRALLLWFPGPDTATGEDLAELHLHGGRAIVDAVLAALGAMGLRLAEPGEFTRRAFFNGRIDLAEAEGLADLLAAETESQRREAMRRADGALGRMLNAWATRLTNISASLEAAIDYDDEVEVDADPYRAEIDALAVEIRAALAVPPAERLREGVRVAIVGPPNAGKSTLFNALVGQDAAIVSPTAGTTRDVIERPFALAGRPLILVDTAGLRETDDAIEAIGVDRARREASLADIVIDLEGEGGTSSLAISAKCDLAPPRPNTLALSAVTGAGMAEFRDALVRAVDRLLPGEGDVALNRRYREGLAQAAAWLDGASNTGDIVLLADQVGSARKELLRLTGKGDMDDVLDALFGRFCLGK